jgi:hypothetical protein
MEILRGVRVMIIERRQHSFIGIEAANL